MTWIQKASLNHKWPIPCSLNFNANPTRIISGFFSINLQVVQYFTIVQKSTLLREEICEIYTNLYRLQTRFLRPFQNTEHNERFGGNEGRKGGCGAEGPLEALGAY